MSDASRASRSRRALRGVGVALALQAAALVVVAGTQDPALRPVTAALGGNPRQLVSQVDVGIALAVVVALLAIGRFAPSRQAAWIDPLLTTPIAVFVIAQLNAVEDLGALVGIYALASAGVLFGMLAGASAGAGAGSASVASWHRARSFGAAVGIVPWGIIAFHQVGAGIAGSPVGGVVVAITLVALVFAVAESVFAWRGSEALATGGRILGLSVVAWSVVVAL